MRWRSGLSRLWLVGSIAWVAYYAWHSDLSCPLELIGIGTGAGLWCMFPIADPVKYYTDLSAKMFGVPLLAGLAIIAASWVIGGFRRR